MSQKIFDQLKQPLDVNRVSKRQGGGSMMLSYIETHDVISTLNKIFGYDGWSFELLECQEKPCLNGFIFRQFARLTVRFEGQEVRREDVGIGVATQSSGTLKSDTIEKAYKEAASDALKRCGRTLGDQFGNSLYEKDAPEHKGQQRGAIATSEQLALCESLRIQAVELGHKHPKTNLPPDPFSSDSPAAQVEKRTEIYRKFIQENSQDSRYPLDEEGNESDYEAAPNDGPEPLSARQEQAILAIAAQVFGRGDKRHEGLAKLVNKPVNELTGLEATVLIGELREMQAEKLQPQKVAA